MNKGQAHSRIGTGRPPNQERPDRQKERSVFIQRSTWRWLTQDLVPPCSFKPSRTCLYTFQMQDYQQADMGIVVAPLIVSKLIWIWTASRGLPIWCIN
jgi:hypothetical protein